MIKKLIAAASVLSMLLLLISPAAAFSPGTATTTADWLNFRTAPSMSGRVMDLIPYGSEINIIQELDGWCMIEWNGVTGYVSSQYIAQDLSAQDADGVSCGLILGDEVRFRQTASLTGDVLGYFYRGVLVKVLEEGSQWTKVEFKEKIGYVSSQYIRLGTPTAEERKTAEAAYYIFIYKATVSQPVVSVSVQTSQTTTQPAAQGNSSTCSADDIVASAKACLGVPYKYGGADMKGFDCSGFTSYVYAQNGISLSRTATAQYNQGTYVSKSELQPGDLVFFTNESSGSSIGHAGIYIGNGKLIHASSGSSKMIVIAELDSVWFANHYYGACRILK